MRFTGLLLIMFAATVLVLGCNQNNPSSKNADAKTANAQEKIKDAVNATDEALLAKRDEYARELHKRLDELDVKYEDLKVLAAKAEAQSKVGLERKIEQAKAKRDVAASKLHELKEAGADRWEKVKESVGHAFDDLKTAFD